MTPSRVSLVVGNLIAASNAAEGITFRYCNNADGTVDRIAPPPLDELAVDDDTSGSSCRGHRQGNDTLFGYHTNLKAQTGRPSTRPWPDLCHRAAGAMPR